MVNITHPELSETKTPNLPAADIEILKKMREEMCSDSSSKDFKLQPQQRFLRRVLSPESSTRNLLMVHGTGTGKTCTAIQIAEEYIIRPEFQSKKVLILANPSVKENFRNEIFNIDKLNVTADDMNLTKQCTGRRYLEIIQRAQTEPLRITDAVSRDRVLRLSNRVIDEFYEFMGYDSFAIMVNEQEQKSANEFKNWIHETFDNRLMIIDEAHNIRAVTEGTTSKISPLAINTIIKTANNITLVLLTATPMFDDYEEIMYYFNLFLWNDRKLDLTKTISSKDVFRDGQFREGQEERFRGWCQDYVSYIKGENPFTFPFRLPPPENMIAPIDRRMGHDGKAITKPRQYLTLTQSVVSPFQEQYLKALQIKIGSVAPPMICVLPNNGTFTETFERVENKWNYRKGVDNFLAPSKVAEYSSKFALIMNILEKSTGIVIVYSNLVEYGTNLFSMCLEEHGYENAITDSLLFKSSGEVQKGSRGKYVSFTSDTTDIDIKKTLYRLRSKENINGQDIRVIVASPKVSEGVTFSNVRQIHILDPWWNMSRIEQVIGRGMRTCQHASLPFEEQNCTVYLHVCRYSNTERETPDEYMYRVHAEEKAVRIAKIKRVIMESAMDCPLQQSINSLPKDWRELSIPQIRSQDRKKLDLTLEQMSAPSFEDTVTDLVCRTKNDIPDPDHVRPLSAILDIRDEVFDKLIKLFRKKPIWSFDALYKQPSMQQYKKDVLEYLIQNAIESHFEFKDKYGRKAFLTSRDGLLTLTFNEYDTLVEKIIQEDKGEQIELKIQEMPKEEKEEEDINIVSKRNSYKWPSFIKGFDTKILDWYVVDNLLTSEDRIKHLLNLDWNKPPFYAKDLYATMPNGRVMFILGHKQIYDQDKKLFTPIGEEKDVYMEWVNDQKRKFLEHGNDIFASMKENTIIFNIDEKSDTIQKAERSKTIGGRMCTTYNESILNAFSEWLVGEPFPEEVKTKRDRCMYLDLLVRRAIMQQKKELFWISPQVYDIFSNDDDIRKELLKELK
jgi:hypothetical protein